MWKEENNSLQASFEFKDFVHAFAFMTQVAFTAEKNESSSGVENVWNKVDIRLSTRCRGYCH
ncbi:MAG: 4a-hydroxytetrahydrobiopterin dehydratase [Bacteroidetes bacterium]|nr:4a-hydroxytetrahydrobiopterin dehydratase [Bacteroidota bacterium]